MGAIGHSSSSSRILRVRQRVQARRPLLVAPTVEEQLGGDSSQRSGRYQTDNPTQDEPILETLDVVERETAAEAAPRRRTQTVKS